MNASLSQSIQLNLSKSDNKGQAKVGIKSLAVQSDPIRHYNELKYSYLSSNPQPFTWPQSELMKYTKAKKKRPLIKI